MLQNRLKRIHGCRKCGLYRYRKNVVIGRGDLPCDLLIIGEAPGRTENYNGIAFDGQAGMLLDKMLSESGLDALRLYFTNVILCRPCESVTGDNRKPTPDEVLYCSGNVNTIIEKAAPKHVLLLGDVAKTYMKKEFPDAFTAIHPSAILRTGGKQSPMYLSTVRSFEELFKTIRRTDAAAQ